MTDTELPRHINNLARFAIDNPDQMHDIMRQIKELTE